MIVGAVIAAAGKSSRMGAFKPLLDIGGLPAARRIIQSFRTAGVMDIVLVTGCRAGELEDSLRDLDITCLRNDLYEYNEMFESVKIGLEYAKDKFGKIFITPVDAPLFLPETVSALIDSDAGITIPLYQGKTGHPVIMKGDTAGDILSYNGAGGLRGAIAKLSPARVSRIEVSDSGILYDMDTPDDYAAIVSMQAAGRGNPK